MKTLILIFVFVASLNAQAADFSGTWTGIGNGIDYAGTVYGCTVDELTISQSAQKLTISAGDVECGVLFWRWPNTELSITGDQLSLNGKAVGNIQNDSIQMDIPTSGENSKSVTLTWNNGKISYLDKKIDRDGVFFTIDAVLNPK